MMKTTTDRQTGSLLKKFHTLCMKAGFTPEEKALIVGSFGHDSSRELTLSELVKACEVIEAKVNPQAVKLDIWRKRVIASIAGWHRIIGVEYNINYIKSIASRDSAYKSFNDIPIDRLRNLYAAFNNKQKDFKRVDGIAKEELETLTYLN